MNDVVAIRLTIDSGEQRFFLTWGRIQDRVDPTPLQALVLSHAEGFDLGGRATAAAVVPLREASSAPYFFEYFFSMCQEKIPSGTRYEQWRARVEREMNDGAHLYYLGAE